MAEYLIFRLYGPLASWGQAAVGGNRHTATCPTRSALLGFLACAMGITRDKEMELQALQGSVQFGVKQCVPSTLLRDYHTTQVPPTKRNVFYNTRKEELSGEKLNTILSSRDYRCDGLWIVAVRSIAEGNISLVSLQQALEKPVFSLYLGRKSCSLALPLKPMIVDVANLKEALDHPFPEITSSIESDLFWLKGNGQVTYFWEGDKEEFAEESVLTTYPWDEPVHRERWQFSQCERHQITIAGV